MDLLQLRYFAAVARHQNVTQAALEFSIPQPAMSRTISNLERELGLPLFDRASNRIILNQNGRQFYSSVRQILQTLDEGITGLKAGTSTRSVEIKLLILQSRNLIIDLIADFGTLFPQIKFTIYHNHSYPKNFEFDFCLASADYNANSLRKTLLFSEEIMIAVNADHPFAQKAYITIDDLRGEKFISMPLTSELEIAVDKVCQKHDFVPDNLVVCDDPFYVRKYVSRGMGIAFAPSISWQGLWPENVILLHIDQVDFRRSTCLFAQRSENQTDECLTFQNYLLTRLNML